MPIVNIQCSSHVLCPSEQMPITFLVNNRVFVPTLSKYVYYLIRRVKKLPLVLQISPQYISNLNMESDFTIIPLSILPRFSLYMFVKNTGRGNGTYRTGTPAWKERVIWKSLIRQMISISRSSFLNQSLTQMKHRTAISNSSYNMLY
jgi:hypothetical protein